MEGNQNFSMAAGDDRVLDFTTTGLSAVSDVDEATWVLMEKAGGTVLIRKTLDVVIPAPGGITVALDPEGLLISVALAAADTEALAGIYRHELSVDSAGVQLTVAQGKAVIRESLSDPTGP